jgi:MFS family permease
LARTGASSRCSSSSTRSSARWSGSSAPPFRCSPPDTFHLTSVSLSLSFLIAFGLVKAFTNLAAGHGMTRYGRRPVLLAGWVCALPVAPLILTADSWAQVVLANVFLGLNQGLAWSATVVMKIDLAGPRRRGLALGLNEAAGYGAVALAAYTAGVVAARHDPRAAFWLTAGIALIGLLVSLAARETRGHAQAEAAQTTGDRTVAAPTFRATFTRTSWGHRPLAVVSFSGLVNQLNDALAWGLLPTYLLTRGLHPGQVGLVAAAYPAVWAISQPPLGALSDRIGRSPLLIAGFLIQAGALAVFAGPTNPGVLVAAAAALGLGTGMVYPTLIAVIGDHTTPDERPAAVGTYRLWRDLGYVAGALITGVVADAIDARAAVLVIAALTAVPAAAIAATALRPAPTRS